MEAIKPAKPFGIQGVCPPSVSNIANRSKKLADKAHGVESKRNEREEGHEEPRTSHRASSFAKDPKGI